MAFVLKEFNKDEIREYNVWDSVNKFIPKGGIADIEKDIRLIPYKKVVAMEPDDRYLFIYDYKGTVINLTISSYVRENKTIYEYTGSDKLLNEEELKNLREAVKVYGNRMFYMGILEDESDTIVINF